MRLGEVQLDIVSDGDFLVDAGGVFGVVPRVLWEKVAQTDERNRLRTALNCLVIVSEGKRILVDTGLGSKLAPKDQELHGVRRPQEGLLGELQRLGWGPDDIDIVVNTHLHWDHSGGNTLLKEGVPVPSFPRAQYLVQRLEWADAAYPNERTRNTYLAENLRPLQQSGQLSLLSGDMRITRHVRCFVTRGHTRAHQCVAIESNGETALFLGDLASRPVQMERLGWISAFDTEPLETLETKRALREWALERHALLFFEHDLGMPMGYLRRQDDRYAVESTAG
jgi:glyoxylase-like metal-dependent hydrolase (beta-lactamase superfamily II)